MIKSSKLWIICATIFAIGIAIFAISMTALGWDFSKLTLAKTEENTYTVADDFTSISLSFDTADVSILPSEDGKARVDLVELTNVKHEVKVENGKLTVSHTDNRAWYEYISLFGSGATSVTVYLPEGKYESFTAHGSTGDVKISNGFEFESIDVEVSTANIQCFASAKSAVLKASTGDIYLSDATAQNVKLSATTGNISASRVLASGAFEVTVSSGNTTLTDVNCDALSFTSSTGDLLLTRFIANGKLECRQGTGDITFDSSDAGEILITASTGDVCGTLLSPKLFAATSNTGKVSVPDPEGTQKCKISVSTGDIIISIKD